MSMAKKYIVFPGYIGKHYISAKRLIQLYGVDWKACVVVGGLLSVREMSDVIYSGYYRDQKVSNLVWLTPREDGNYKGSL